jgi:hypothetical protein
VARKPSDIVQVNLRISEGLRRLIAAEARRNKRSVNQEMAHRLNESFNRELRADALLVIAQKAANDAVEMAFERLGLNDRMIANMQQQPKERDRNGK